MQIETAQLSPSYGRIYRLTNKVNGKMYHGQTTIENINDRWTKYKNLNCKGQPKIYRALKKYGWDNFIAEVIDTTPQNQPQLDELEIFYIAKFDSMNNGYNCDPGGRGGKKSEETKNRLSKNLSGQGNPMFGRKQSDETKRKIALTKIGKKSSEETKLKMSEAHMGKKLSDETKRKISESKSGSKHHNFNKHISNEIRQKMSTSHTGKIMSEETRNKMCKSLRTEEVKNKIRVSLRLTRELKKLEPKT